MQKGDKLVKNIFILSFSVIAIVGVACSRHRKQKYLDTDVIICLLTEECIASESNQLFLNTAELTYAFVQAAAEQRRLFRMPEKKTRV